MARRNCQLRVRDPDVFLLLPATPLAHRHARILRTQLVDTAQVFGHVSRLAPQAVRQSRECISWAANAWHSEGRGVEGSENVGSPLMLQPP
jgi:hypothetical protein